MRRLSKTESPDVPGLDLLNCTTNSCTNRENTQTNHINKVVSAGGIMSGGVVVSVIPSCNTPWEALYERGPP